MPGNPTSEIDVDIRHGLAPAFDVANIDFPFNFIGTMDLAAVPWVASTVHVGEFEGIAPTGLTVEIRGVTIYDATNPSGAAQFSRVIDWSWVYAQLGIVLYARPIEPAI